MKNGTDLGRSVFSSVNAVKPIVFCLPLLLACSAIGANFLACEKVSAAEEERTPLAAVAVTAEPLTAVAVTTDAGAAAEPAAAQEAEPLAPTPVTAQTAEPLTPTPVVQNEAGTPAASGEALEATTLIPEVEEPDSYVNDYLGFTRTDLVAYLVDHADEYLGTPYKEETVAPVLGEDGHMQCEGFIWDVMLAVTTQNETDIPCGNIRTEPANGGGWVNWSYYHKVDPITFNTKDEMLASGILEKGDVIWSFDVAGPYGLSNSNHVGFFWGDTPHDDKFWESAVATGASVYAGSADGNRISTIESMAQYPSVWWVFKLSPDDGYDPGTWAGLPAAAEKTEESDEASADTEEAEDAVPEKEEAAMEELPIYTEESTEAEPAEEPETADVPVPETADTDTEVIKEKSEEGAAAVKEKDTKKEEKEIVFYNGDEEEQGYYSRLIAEDSALYSGEYYDGYYY